MRQLATDELTVISGGNQALILVGLVGFTALTIGLIASAPLRPRQPICEQVVTPVYDPYTGIYQGDMVDTYCH